MSDSNVEKLAEALLEMGIDPQHLAEVAAKLNTDVPAAGTHFNEKYGVPAAGWPHCGQLLAATLADHITRQASNAAEAVLHSAGASMDIASLLGELATSQRQLEDAECLVVLARGHRPCHPWSHFADRYCREVIDTYNVYGTAAAVSVINQIDAGMLPDQIIPKGHPQEADVTMRAVSHADYKATLAGLPLADPDFAAFCACFPFLRDEKCRSLYFDDSSLGHYLITTPPLKVRGTFHAIHWDAKARLLELDPKPPGDGTRWLHCSYESFCTQYAEEHWAGYLLDGAASLNGHTVEFRLIDGGDPQARPLVAVAVCGTPIDGIIKNASVAAGMPNLDPYIVFSTTDSVERTELLRACGSFYAARNCRRCGGWFADATTCACCGAPGESHGAGWEIPLPSTIHYLVELETDHRFTLRHADLLACQRRAAVVRVGRVVVDRMTEAMTEALALIPDQALRAMVGQSLSAPQLILPDDGPDRRARALDFLNDHDHEDTDT